MTWFASLSFFIIYPTFKEPPLYLYFCTGSVFFLSFIPNFETFLPIKSIRRFQHFHRKQTSCRLSMLTVTALHINYTEFMVPYHYFVWKNILLARTFSMNQVHDCKTSYILFMFRPKRNNKKNCAF